MKEDRPNRFLFLLAASVCGLFLFSRPAFAPPSITCTQDGDFGTVAANATITSTNNITMSTTGAITYDTDLTGPATGTPVICLVSGFAGNQQLRVRCDDVRTIANPAGCCGTTNRSINRIRVRAVGNTTLNETDCDGIGSNAGNFRVDGSGNGTIYVGVRMDATHVKIGGTYQLSNHASGPVNVAVRTTGGGATTYGPDTADFSVSFTSRLSVTGSQDMDFSNISISTVPAAGDYADLGTNGTVAFSGNFAVGPSPSPAAGNISIGNAENGVILEVYCDQTATLTRTGGGSIQATGIKVAREGTTGTYAGAGSLCNGIAGAAATTMTYNSTTGNQFFFGGRLDGSTASAFTVGDYSTGNAGGDSLSIIVLNQ